MNPSLALAAVAAFFVALLLLSNRREQLEEVEARGEFRATNAQPFPLRPRVSACGTG